MLLTNINDFFKRRVKCHTFGNCTKLVSLSRASRNDDSNEPYSRVYQGALFAQRGRQTGSRDNLYRIKRYVCSRGDDVQRSIELLDKVLSEYDEHDAEGEGGGGGSGSGGGGCVGGGGNGGVGDCGSSTEPSIGLTPDDESPSLGTLFLVYRFSPFLISSRDERTTSTPLARVCRARLTDVRAWVRRGPPFNVLLFSLLVRDCW